MYHTIGVASTVPGTVPVGPYCLSYTTAGRKVGSSMSVLCVSYEYSTSFVAYCLYCPTSIRRTGPDEDGRDIAHFSLIFTCVVSYGCKVQ